MTEREQFEAWAKPHLDLKVGYEGDYSNFSTLAAWLAWQAARAAPSNPSLDEALNSGDGTYRP